MRDERIDGYHVTTGYVTTGYIRDLDGSAFLRGRPQVRDERMTDEGITRYIEERWTKDMTGRSGFLRLVHDISHQRSGLPHRWGARTIYTRECTVVSWTSAGIVALVVEAYRAFDEATRRSYWRIDTTQRRYSDVWTRRPGDGGPALNYNTVHLLLRGNIEDFQW